MSEVQRDIIKELPEDFRINSKEDLINKLNKGLDDIKSGRVLSIDEAFNKAERLFVE